MTDNERVRRDLESVYRAAVAAADPSMLVNRVLDGQLAGAVNVAEIVGAAERVFVLAAGKAAPAMASALGARLGARLTSAVVVTLPGHDVSAPAGDSRFRLVESSHPLPSEASIRAAQAAIELMQAVRESDLAIVALSGGASAMLAMPADGVTLQDKLQASLALQRAGASIRELNTVRKHLSAIKGGRLARETRAGHILGLFLSDVPGNDLATIGSGPTAPDSTTYADAIGVFKRHRLWGRAPESIRDHLERGNSGEVPETVRADDAVFSRVTNVVIGDNSTAVEAALRRAREAGYDAERWRPLQGEANDLGRSLAAHLCAFDSGRVCVIAGGEPVVTVKGSGKGGRAQQAALAMAMELARIGAGRNVAALFAGTDGIDGPTDAAGAFAFPDTVRRGHDAGLDADQALFRNDSYNFLAAAGDLFITGPTGTNVADIFIGLSSY